MKFKVVSQLSNTRPAKSDSPELSTTPTAGNIKINAPAAEKMRVGAGDYLTIVKAETEEGLSLFVTKGNPSSKNEATGEEVKQSGSILSGTGSLLFSSENAFRELGGNDATKKVYTIGDAVEDEGKQYFPLTFARDEEKIARHAKA